MFDFIQCFLMGYTGCFHFEMEDWELAGCGGEMFPSSGGRTDPGHDFRPRAGVMAPLCRSSQPVPAPLFPALLMSPTGTGYAAQESKQDFQHSVSSGELLSVLWLLGALEWELLVLSSIPIHPHPAPSLFTSSGLTTSLVEPPLEKNSSEQLFLWKQ